MNSPPLITLPALLLLSLAPQGAAAQRALSKPAAREEDRFLNGRPFSFDDLRLALAVPEARLRRAIESRGLDFTLAPGDLEKLRAAGASEAVLDLVRRHARPAPPPEPPQPKFGTLGLTCEPVECEIAVNGSRRGVTAAGKLDLTGLAPGPVSIEFRKEGYLTAKVEAVVEPGRLTPAFARLEPDAATREQRGAQLYRRMVDALGGEAGLREARSLEAAGSAEIFTGDGKRTAYSLQFRLHLPDQAIFRVRGASLTYDFAFTGGQYNSNGKIKGDDAQRLETIFRAFREYQLPALLERVAGYRFSAARVIPVAGEDYFLLADGGAEKITLALDKESRPQFVTLENRSGLGSGDTITYSAYSRQGGGVLPMVTHIRLQDAGRTGLEIRLDRLSVNRNFTAKDFQIRRNSFR